MRTLYDKIWESHVVSGDPNGTALLYIDRHLIHEVSSPQAFECLRDSGYSVRRPGSCLAVADHAVPTQRRDMPIANALSRAQVDRLVDNSRFFGIPYLPLTSRHQGIVHVVGPELGFTLPGITLVCGDSHTSTHGALGAMGFGIGTSECATVLATQCLRQRRAKTFCVLITGRLQRHVTAKDLALTLTSSIGSAGAAGYAIEYMGEAVAGLSVEQRMTLCNMAIETGARVALVSPDDATLSYLEGRPLVPRGKAWEAAIDFWRTLHSEPDAIFDRTEILDAERVGPVVTWGTNPEDAAPVSGRVPDPASITDNERRARITRALEYMDLKPGTSIEGITIDRVFIGSCTNARIEDLRAAAAILMGRRVCDSVSAMVVPGSTEVRRQAESEGLHRIFKGAGFEWRESGCSMCVAMNEDRLKPGQRCASTSNRNFEGRQGQGGRTHLMSPAMAAAAAIAGHIADVRRIDTV